MIPINSFNSRNYKVRLSINDSVNYNNLNSIDKGHIDRNLTTIEEALEEILNVYIYLRRVTRSSSNIAESLYLTLSDNHKKICKNDPTAFIAQKNEELRKATIEKTTAETAATTAAKTQIDRTADVTNAQAALGTPPTAAQNAALKLAQEALEKANKDKDEADKQLIIANNNFNEKTTNKELADQYNGCINNHLFSKETIERLILKFEYEYINRRTNIMYLKGGGFITKMISSLAKKNNYTFRDQKLIDTLYYLDRIDKSQLHKHQDLILSLIE